MGIGFSSNSYMPGTRVILGGTIGKNNFVGEGFIFGYSPPSLDKIETIEDVSFQSLDGVNNMRFTKSITLNEKDVDLTAEEGAFLIFPVGCGDIRERDSQAFSIRK